MKIAQIQKRAEYKVYMSKDLRKEMLYSEFITGKRWQVKIREFIKKEKENENTKAKN